MTDPLKYPVPVGRMKILPFQLHYFILMDFIVPRGSHILTYINGIAVKIAGTEICFQAMISSV